jgi:hypothetical protein
MTLDWKDDDKGSTALDGVGGKYRIEIESGYSEEGICRYYKVLRTAPVGFPLTTLESAKMICQAHHDRFTEAKKRPR